MSGKGKGGCRDQPTAEVFDIGCDSDTDDSDDDSDDDGGTDDLFPEAPFEEYRATTLGAKVTCCRNMCVVGWCCSQNPQAGDVADWWRQSVLEDFGFRAKPKAPVGVPQVQAVEKTVPVPLMSVQTPVQIVVKQVPVTTELDRECGGESGGSGSEDGGAALPLPDPLAAAFPVPQVQTVEKVVDVPQVQAVEKTVLVEKQVPVTMAQDAVKQVLVPQVQTVGKAKANEEARAAEEAAKARQAAEAEAAAKDKPAVAEPAAKAPNADKPAEEAPPKDEANAAETPPAEETPNEEVEVLQVQACEKTVEMPWSGGWPEDGGEALPQLQAVEGTDPATMAQVSVPQVQTVEKAVEVPQIQPVAKKKRTRNQRRREKDVPAAVPQPGNATDDSEVELAAVPQNGHALQYAPIFVATASDSERKQGLVERLNLKHPDLIDGLIAQGWTLRTLEAVFGDESVVPGPV